MRLTQEPYVRLTLTAETPEERERLDATERVIRSVPHEGRSWSATTTKWSISALVRAVDVHAVLRAAGYPGAPG